MEFLVFSVEGYEDLEEIVLICEGVKSQGSSLRIGPCGIEGE